MKKSIVILSLLSLCIWLISAVFTTQAQEENSEDVATAAVISQEEEISYQELETETPKLLPNNPFHFIKKWGWGIKRALTFNPVKRLELELEINNKQAAEIKRLEETDPNNIKAIEKAADNYQENVERLKNRLEAIKETSQNPNVDKLLDKLTDRFLKHQQLFDNLKTKLEEHSALKEKLDDIKSRVDDIIVKIPEKFEDASKFKERVQKIIGGQRGKCGNGICEAGEIITTQEDKCEVAGSPPMPVCASVTKQMILCEQDCKKPEPATSPKIE